MTLVLHPVVPTGKVARARAPLRRGLLDHNYEELPILGAHAVDVQLLPSIHKDPFDRLLVAQAIGEAITLLTMDETVGRYPGPIRMV